MTPKQIEKTLKEIANIKRTLAAEKRKIGCYDDSRGLRYIPTSLYIKLQDYENGLIYIKWFQKNFPDDSGFPNFLFECAIIYFKTGNLKLAETKTFETFCSNTYLIDKFLDSPIIPIDKDENSNWDSPEFCKYLIYTSSQLELSDFTDWLIKFIVTEKFVTLSAKYIEITKRLKKTEDRETRGYLIKQMYQLKI